MAEPGLIVHMPDVIAPDTLAQWGNELSALIDRPLAEPKISAGVEASDVRRVTVQLRDRIQRNRTGRQRVLVWVSTTAQGDPAGTQTVTVVDGYTLATIASNQAYELLTDAAGKVTLDIEVTGAGTRYVHALTHDRAVSAAFEWSA